MIIELSEVLLLVSGGCLVSSFIAIIHFVSTYNSNNRSLAFFSAFAIGSAAFFTANISTNHSKSPSLEFAMSSAILGLLELLPIFLVVITLVLFRISLLTNRSVDASS